jgi:hypothetical protein
LLTSQSTLVLSSGLRTVHVWHWMDVQFERIATETLNGFACCCCGTVCVVVLCLDSGLCEQTTKVVGTGHASKRANIRELEQRCGGEAGSGTMVSEVLLQGLVRAGWVRDLSKLHQCSSA